MNNRYDAAALRSAAYRKTWRKAPLRVRLQPVLLVLHHAWRVMRHPFCHHTSLRTAKWMRNDPEFYVILSRRCMRCDRLFPVDPPEKVIEPQ